MAKTLEIKTLKMKYGTKNYALDGLCRVDPIVRIKTRIIFVINELMVHCRHHVTHHVGATQHRFEFPCS